MPVSKQRLAVELRDIKGKRDSYLSPLSVIYRNKIESYGDIREIDDPDRLDEYLRYLIPYATLISENP